MKVCWLHGNQDITSDNKVYQLVSDGNTHKLIIPDVFVEDGGEYICEAYNKYGDSETSCAVTVLGKRWQGFWLCVGQGFCHVCSGVCGTNCMLCAMKRYF